MPYTNKEKDKEWHRKNARETTRLANEAKKLLGLPVDKRRKPKLNQPIS